MAYLVYVISIPNESITQLNAISQRPTKPNEMLNAAENIVDALAGGLKNGTIQVTTRDTDPAVSTSGSGSQQFSYSKA